MVKKDISVIIPCYNTEVEYLQQAIDSVLAYKGSYTVEIIISDDGSTAIATLNWLAYIVQKGITVLYQENKGPAAARNTGVKKSASEFILFLDSDNKIMPEYIDEGINALLSNEKACMAYGNPLFFGETNERNFEVAEFDVQRLLLQNYIDTCVVVRKKAWNETGGMDEAKELIGYEDWEFWINLYKAGWEFIYIKKTLFEYRVRKGSLITRSPAEKFKEAVEYIYKKHPDLIYQCYHQLYVRNIMYKNDMQKPLRSLMKYSKKKYLP